MPDGLNGVVAIAAGDDHSLALKTDGTIVAWGRNEYGQLIVPSGLNGVAALVAGVDHSLALKNDGTIVAWGRNDCGESTVPGGLRGVKAVAAGWLHSLALKTDGTVAAWGWNDQGQCTVPDGLNGVVAIAAGANHSLALVRDATAPEGPVIIFSPQRREAPEGDAVTFSVIARGTPPLQYQWRRNGINLPGATGTTLTLPAVTAADSGEYAVRVWNAYGAVVSAPAHLAVLADGADGRQPQLVNPTIELPDTPGQDHLILVTHGWNSNAEAKWLTSLVDALQARVPPHWAVMALDWRSGAKLPRTPNQARDNAMSWGQSLGKVLAPRHFVHIHFIAHSAGAALIDQATRRLKALPLPPEIHCTFLDPFTGGELQGREQYGEEADWADNYFVRDMETDVGGGAIPKYSMGSTMGPLTHAYNVDVTIAEPLHLKVVQYYWSGSGTVAGGKLPVVAQPSHASPCWFYLRTVTGQADACVGDFGFGFSKAGGGWADRGTRVRGEKSIPVGACAETALSPSLLSKWFSQPIQFDAGAFVGNSGTVILGAHLLKMASIQPAPVSGQGDPPEPFGDPAWYARAVEITPPINFVSFDAAFAGADGTNGLLTVYWNTNQIGAVEERVAGAAWQRYALTLPAPLSEGIYTLSFRLDAFGGAASVEITNVVTGYRGLTNPITLRMVAPATNQWALELTAPAGYNYLVESSSTLETWQPAAVLMNTNGTVRFPDPAIHNANPRFYRAVVY